ncbi:hypothetical protein [Cuniculiplasma divulgatum]|nr:hypothetical protein [Cuniculiplasma divulgatum]
MQSIDAIIMFLLIAVIISYFRAFLVFVFYSIVVGIVVIILSMVVGYIFGLTFSNIGKISGADFMFWTMGDIVLTIGISAFLTKRARDKEEGREREYDRPPNPDDYSNSYTQEPKEKVVTKIVERVKEVQKPHTKKEIGTEVP